MAQIGGHVDVRAGRADRVEEAVSGTAAHGDAADALGGIARHAHAAGRGGQRRVHGPGEGGQVGLLGQVAHPADAFGPGAGGGGRQGRERSGDADGTGQHVRDTVHDGVGVGVRREQGDAVLDQGVQQASLGGGGMPDGGDGRGPAQQERVVGDHEVGPAGDGLVGHGLHGVQRPQDGPHRGLRAPGHRPDGVPRLRQLPRPQPLDDLEDLPERRWGQGVLRRGGDGGTGHGHTGHDGPPGPGTHDPAALGEGTARRRRE